MFVTVLGHTTGNVVQKLQEGCFHGETDDSQKWIFSRVWIEEKKVFQSREGTGAIMRVTVSRAVCSNSLDYDP